MFRFLKRKSKRNNLPAGEERRREPRHRDLNEMSLEPRETLEQGPPKRKYYARTKNASPSGLRVECEVRFPVDSLVDIRLESPKTGKVIWAGGKVKWVQALKDERGFEIGIEFVETSIDTIMNLLEHIYRA
jgi:hypothetical protein